jgi:hypothetical protein
LLLKKPWLYLHSKWSKVVVLNYNSFHFVNLLSFASSYFFLSLSDSTPK